MLVAITAVSYTVITKSDKEAALKSDLKQVSTALEVSKAKTGTYPTSLATNNPPISQPKNTNLTYTQLSADQSYSLTATSSTNPDIVLTTSSTGGIAKPSPNIQTITKANCPTSRTQVKDARDNSSYYIQKLADNQCWMLTSLAYAGGGTNTYSDVIDQGTGAPGTPGTLNNGTADTGRTYTLAKYYIHEAANPTIDPTPPSTDTTGGGSGAGRQYGYYYNYCAAMGGQDTAACANATTPAPIPTTNICPAGWRLPTGEPTTGEFTALNTAINGGLTTTDAGLRTNGLFQRSGAQFYGFGGQGSYGDYWSSSQYSSTNARYLTFRSTNVYPATNNNKFGGFAVRCIAL